MSQIDKPVCVEISTARGYCVTIISAKETEVDDTHLMNGKSWFEAKIDMILVPPETWAELKKYLIINCKKSKACDRNIDSWTRSIDGLDEQRKKKGFFSK